MNTTKTTNENHNYAKSFGKIAEHTGTTLISVYKDKSVKLTAEDEKEVLRLRNENKLSFRELAKKYHCSVGKIETIIYGKTKQKIEEAYTIPVCNTCGRTLILPSEMKIGLCYKCEFE